MTELHLAAIFGTPELCGRVLDSGVSPDLFEQYYATPLHAASANGRLDNVNLLLRRGACVDTEDRFGCTPLFSAAHEGDVEVMKALLDAGADTEHVDNDGNTVLAEIAKTDETSAAQLLLDRGANAKHVSAEVTTPLHKAIQANKLEMTRTLLMKHKNVECAGYEGLLPLHFAVTCGDLALVKLLCAFGAHVDAPDNPRMPPIFGAIRAGKADIVPFLLDSSAKISWKNLTVLHAAAMFRSPNFMKLLLSHISNSEISTTVLINQACDSGETPLHIAAKEGDIETVRILLAAGAEVNVEDRFSKTPLNYAIDNEKDDVQDFLLGQGATSSTPLTRTAIIVFEDGNTTRLDIELEIPRVSDEELIGMLRTFLGGNDIFDKPIRQIKL